MIGESASKAIEQSKNLARDTWEYYRLKWFAQIVGLTSMLMKVLIVGGLSMIALFLFSIALAEFLGDVLKNEALGYVGVGIVFLLIAGIIYGSRKCIENKVVRKLSKNFFEE